MRARAQTRCARAAATARGGTARWHAGAGTHELLLAPEARGLLARDDVEVLAAEPEGELGAETREEAVEAEALGPGRRGGEEDLDVALGVDVDDRSVFLALYILFELSNRSVVLRICLVRDFQLRSLRPREYAQAVELGLHNIFASQ